ncbi:hypothetical protein VTH82DRAFT_7694 [Thermothelomyces myriococcoides]
MSGINQILKTFESLAEDDRETTMRALSTIMRAESQRQPAKKKVNGFMGYREKSPIMTMLWKEDPFHKEWDFMCSVYSEIREFLSDEDVTLQEWLRFATKHMGIVVRESYLTTLGWRLVQDEDGTHKIERTETQGVQSSLQPTNGLGLFMKCFNDGLPVSNPLPIIAKLSGLTNDIICINTQPGAETRSIDTMEGFRQLAKNHPHFAMSALFQVPAGHPLIAQGVTVHQLPDSAGFPATELFPTTQSGDPELDALLDRIFQGEGDADFSNQANFGDEHLAMSMRMNMDMDMDMSMGMGNSTTDFN